MLPKWCARRDVERVDAGLAVAATRVTDRQEDTLPIDRDSPVVASERAAGFHLLTASEFAARGVSGTLEDINRIARAPVYVSLDIDCVDPAYAPGTGTPEVAGLTSREIVELVRGLPAASVVGFDIVEVAPAYDQAEITSLLAANLVYEFLLILAASR